MHLCPGMMGSGFGDLLAHPCYSAFSRLAHNGFAVMFPTRRTHPKVPIRPHMALNPGFLR